MNFHNKTKQRVTGADRAAWALSAIIGISFLLASLAALPARADGLMMALPGKFSVSTTGGALYSIPIEVPPGTGGMKSELSIDYTSQSTHGSMDVGYRCFEAPPVAQVSVRFDIEGGGNN